MLAMLADQRSVSGDGRVRSGEVTSTAPNVTREMIVVINEVTFFCFVL